MPSAEFLVDVDGFAFANNFTFDAQERQQIRDIIAQVAPGAAAALAPLLAAASPLVVATVAPFVGLAGPVLPLLPWLAPVIADKLVEAVIDAMGADYEGNLCSGMAHVALDYHRLRWVTPRGAGPGDTPKRLPDGGNQVSDMVRAAIWDRQLESHLKDSPRLVAWLAAGMFLGDLGAEWLRDRTRDEIAKLATLLSGGEAVPIAMVWRTDKFRFGHVIVASRLDWLAPNWCLITVWDNELPDKVVVFEVDTRGDRAIIRQTDSERTYAALFCTDYEPRVPKPAVTLDGSFGVVPVGFAGVARPVEARFQVLNSGWADIPDQRLAVTASGKLLTVDAPPFGGATGAEPLSSGQRTPVNPVPFKVNEAGYYDLVPAVALPSARTPVPVIRRLPLADGSAPPPVRLRVTPRLPIVFQGRSKGAACAMLPIEGTSIILSVDPNVLSGLSVKWVRWSVTGDLQLTVQGATLTIPALPPAPGRIDVEVVAELTDGSEAYGAISVHSFTSAVAMRNQRLCELAHVVSHAPLSNIPIGPGVDPLRLRASMDAFDEALSAERMAAKVREALQRFERSGEGGLK